MIENITKLLFFDIETVSIAKTVEELKENYGERYLKQWEGYRNTFIKRYTHEWNDDITDDELLQNTGGLFPEFGKVVCTTVGFITKSGEYRLESFCSGDEKLDLKELRDLLNKVDNMDFMLCGHNAKNFDIPFLGKRYLINGMKPPTILPSHDTKPWEVKVLDTKDLWAFSSYNGIGSLDLITTVMDIESPKNGEVRGDNVRDFFWKGELKLIEEYCEKDVKALMDLTVKVNNLK